MKQNSSWYRENLFYYPFTWILIFFPKEGRGVICVQWKMRALFHVKTDREMYWFWLNIRCINLLFFVGTKPLLCHFSFFRILCWLEDTVLVMKPSLSFLITEYCPVFWSNRCPLLQYLF